MSVFISLNFTERFLARTIEMYDLVAIGVPEDEAEAQVTGTKTGAYIAVARMLNLYPNNMHSLGPKLISSKHKTIEVIHTPQKQDDYTVKEPFADVYVLTHSTAGDHYEIAGYAFRKNVQTGKGRSYIYDHVFTLFKEEEVFVELIQQ